MQRHKFTIMVWFLSCSIMSSFTLLPVVKVEDERLMYVFHHFYVQATPQLNLSSSHKSPPYVGDKYL